MEVPSVATGQGQAGDAFPPASSTPALMNYSEQL
jgi:hypothetical protein